MVFTSEAQIQAAMKTACTVAIDKTCEQLWEELRRLIDSEYYQAYTPSPPPEGYVRTMQFYNSALHGMVGNLCGEIFMEAGAMSYTGKDPVWTGEQQLIGAEAGYHGQLAITGGGGFWSKFLAYFAENALPMLKSELQAQGVPVQ